MKLESKLANDKNYKVIAEDCTLGQAFTMIDNWCYDNNAQIDWWGSAYKSAYDCEFYLECTSGDNVVNIFIIYE